MFEERERAYEAKWAHDAEALFRVMARRDAGLAEWAAARMNLSLAEAADYAGAVIQAGMVGRGADPALAKIRDDSRRAAPPVPTMNCWPRRRICGRKPKRISVRYPRRRQAPDPG